MAEEPVYEHENGMNEDGQPKQNSTPKIDENALKLAESRKKHAAARLNEAQGTVDTFTAHLTDLEDKVAAAAYFRRHFSRIHQQQQQELDKAMRDIKKAKDDISHFSKQITIALEDINAIRQGLPPPSIEVVNERLKKRDTTRDYNINDDNYNNNRRRRSRSPSSRSLPPRHGRATATTANIPTSIRDLPPQIESLFLKALDTCLEKFTLPFSIGEINLAMKEAQPQWDMQQDTGFGRFHDLVRIFERAGHLKSVKELRQVVVVDSKRLHHHHSNKGNSHGGGGGEGSSRKRRSSPHQRDAGGEDRQARRRIERGGGGGGGGDGERGGNGNGRSGRMEGRKDAGNNNNNNNNAGGGGASRGGGGANEHHHQDHGRFPGRDDDREDDDDDHVDYESDGEGRFPESRWEPPEDSD